MGDPSMHSLSALFATQAKRASDALERSLN